MVAILEFDVNPYAYFQFTPSFFDTSTSTQYGQAFVGQSNTAYQSVAGNMDSISGPFTPVNSSNSYNEINVVYRDEQGPNDWWLRTDAQNTTAVTGMYFVAEFSTYLGPWLQMTFGSMSNKYHAGTFRGGWSLNPMSTYINNMQYQCGSTQIKTGSKIWLYKYV